jgi:predicted DNA-binding protein (MmcQ/YjbR family)
MTREEFDEIFPTEPPEWTVIVWKNVDDTHDRRVGDRIFALWRHNGKTWHHSSVHQTDWNDVRRTFCEPHLELIDWFISEGPKK